MASTTAPLSSASSLIDLGAVPDKHLLQAVVALVTAEERERAAKDLAAALGAESLLVFVVDPDLGVPLPAPGFPQTLPDGRRWSTFLRQCKPGCIHHSRQVLPGSTRERDIVGVAAQDGSVLVLAGEQLDQAALALVVGLLPLVSAALRGEQAAHASRAQAIIAEHSAKKSELLAGVLDQMRHDLQGALREAEDALRTRDEFLSLASHELKTPLTALLLQVQMLQRAVQRAEPSPFVTRISGMAGSLDRSLRRLQTLTNDLLDVSRIAAGRLDIRRETVNLREVACDVVSRFVDQARDRGCELTVHAGADVIGDWDRSRLDQAITNLIANALTYGQGKPVTLRVTGQATGARLEVQDDGPGIAPEDRERIFRRFERAGMKDDGSGLGLGLHITREIVEGHGGTIRVESALGEGSTFIVELPYQA